MSRTPPALLLALCWSATAQAAGWPALTRPAPQGGGEKDAALVVGIEQYAAVASVPGAAQNAKDWLTWLRTARGVPLSNVTLLVDSEGALEKIRVSAEEAASKVKPGGTLWFVFIGHGAPAKDGRDGLLVGYDAQQEPNGLYARSLPQAELRGLLSKSKASRVVMVLDAGFSGKTGSGSMIVEGLRPLIALDRDVGAKTAVVLTAGKGDQIAGPLPGEKRPAFSYLMLGALRGWADRNGDGKITAEEAIEYANQALAATLEGRRQTPELQARNPNAILATGAKEGGPDLDELALQAAMDPRASEEKPAEASVVVPQAPVSGGEEPKLKQERGEDRRDWVRREPKTGTELLKIPAGAFTLGCEPADEQCDSDEKPARRVEVEGFWMGKTEVSVADYAKCVDAGACGLPGTGGSCIWGTGLSDHPINCVDWHQAEAFCRWIGGRLPSAAEWEYAAKGGEPRIYPWGNEPPDSRRACFGGTRTAPVMGHGTGASRWGLLNMAGNVWE